VKLFQDSFAKNAKLKLNFEAIFSITVEDYGWHNFGAIPRMVVPTNLANVYMGLHTCGDYFLPSLLTESAKAKVRSDCHFAKYRNAKYSAPITLFSKMALSMKVSLAIPSINNTHQK
jgi:hypothetical protein